MWWQDFCDGVVKVFNTPTMISGVTIGMLIIFSITLIARTSIGKKALNKMKGIVKDATERLSTAKTELEDFSKEVKEFKEAKEQEIKDIKEQYEILLVGVEQKKNKLEKLVLDISENIHNGKVQAEVEEYLKEKETEVSNEISSVVETAKEEARSEYEQDIIDLKNEIEALKEIIKNGGEN